jgi:hypothetical protein
MKQLKNYVIDIPIKQLPAVPDLCIHIIDLLF